MSIVEKSLQKNRRLREAEQPARDLRDRARRSADRSMAAAEIEPSARLQPAKVTPDLDECRKRRLLLGRAADKSDGAALAAYRILRTRLLHRARTQGWTTIAVTSANKDDGKTLTAINLVLSIAREKSRDVVLLDLDMRNPSVFRTLGVEPAHEIKDYFETGDNPRDVFVRVNSDNLYVAGNRTPAENASELLASHRFENLIEVVRLGAVDPIIIIDLPPVLLTDDVFVLAPRVDALLMVAAEGVTEKAGLKKALDLVKEFTVAGVVMNRSDEAATGYGYGYEYEYGAKPDSV